MDLDLDGDEGGGSAGGYGKRRKVGAQKRLHEDTRFGEEEVGWLGCFTASTAIRLGPDACCFGRLGLADRCATALGECLGLGCSPPSAFAAHGCTGFELLAVPAG